MYDIYFNTYDTHPELKELFLVTKLFVTLSNLGVKSAAFYIDNLEDPYQVVNNYEMSHLLSIAFMDGEGYE